MEVREVSVLCLLHFLYHHPRHHYRYSELMLVFTSPVKPCATVNDATSLTKNEDILLLLQHPVSSPLDGNGYHRRSGLMHLSLNPALDRPLRGLDTQPFFQEELGVPVWAH